MARCRRTALLAAAVLALTAPPAAARIAFVSERDGEPEIYVMADDGGAQTDLSNDPGSPDVAPSWSPDGTKIVYQRGFGPDGDLWVMDDDGRNDHAIVDGDGGDTAPSWSPDGRRIAFVSDRSGADHLYVAGADGGGTARLETGTADPGDPAWSPDGAKIAYWDSDNQLVRVIGADGSGDHAVGGPGEDALGGDQTPAWSPDGQRLVFASLREIARSYDIWTMGADGGGQQPLTSSPDREIDPAVAAGGRIAYASDAPGDYDVYAMAGDGSGAVRLTTADGDDTAPAWSPGSGGAAQPVTAPKAAGGTTPTKPSTPSRTGTKAKTGLRVRVDYAGASIRVLARRVVVRMPYRLNRAATVTVHLYLHGRLRAWFKHHGKPGRDIATWSHRIASPERWRGRYTVAVVKASEPASRRVIHGEPTAAG